jgi:hypothetical protein
VPRKASPNPGGRPTRTDCAPTATTRCPPHSGHNVGCGGGTLGRRNLAILHHSFSRLSPRRFTYEFFSPRTRPMIHPCHTTIETNPPPAAVVAGHAIDRLRDDRRADISHGVTERHTCGNGEGSSGVPPIGPAGGEWPEVLRQHRSSPLCICNYVKLCGRATPLTLVAVRQERGDQRPASTTKKRRSTREERSLFASPPPIITIHPNGEDVCRAFQRNATIISPTKDKPLSR